MNSQPIPPFVQYIEVGVSHTATVYLVHSIFSYGTNPPSIPEKIKYWVYTTSYIQTEYTQQGLHLYADISYSQTPIEINNLVNGAVYLLILQYDNSPVSDTYTISPFDQTITSPLIIPISLSQNLLLTSPTLQLTCTNSATKTLITQELLNTTFQPATSIPTNQIPIWQKTSAPSIISIVANYSPFQTTYIPYLTISYTIEYGFIPQELNAPLLYTQTQLYTGDNYINTTQEYNGQISSTNILNLTVVDVSYGISYIARISVINEVGQSDWSQWSQPFMLLSPPTLAYAKYDISTKLLSIFGTTNDISGNISSLEIIIFDGSQEYTTQPIQLLSSNLPQSIYINEPYMTNTGLFIKMRSVQISGGYVSPYSEPIAIYTNPSPPQILLVEPSNGCIIVHLDTSKMETSPPYTGGTPVLQYKYAVNNNVVYKAGGLSSQIIITGLRNGVRYQIYIISTNGYLTSTPVDIGKHIPFGHPLPPIIEKALYLENNLEIYFRPRYNGGNGRPTTGYLYKINEYPYIDISAQSQNKHVEYNLSNPAVLRMLSVNSMGLVSTKEEIVNIAFRPVAPIITKVETGEMCAFIYFDISQNTGGYPIQHYRYSINGQSLQVWYGTSAHPNLTSPLKLRGLENGRQYNVRICAFNGYILSPLSNTWEFAVGKIPNQLAIKNVQSFYGGVLVDCEPVNLNGNMGIEIDGYKWYIDGKYYGDTSGNSASILCEQGRHKVSVYAFNKNGNGKMSSEKPFQLYYFIPNKPAVINVKKMADNWKLNIRPSSLSLTSFLPTIGFKYRYVQLPFSPILPIQIKTEWANISTVDLPIVVPWPPPQPYTNLPNMAIEIVAVNLYGISASAIVK